MSSRVLRGEGPAELEFAWPLLEGGLLAAAAARPAGEPDAAGELRRQLAEQQSAHQAQLQAARQEGARQAAAEVEARHAAQLQAALERMGRAVAEAAACRRQMRREAERDIVALALAVARRILRRELSVAPEAVLGLVKAALESLDLREVTGVRVHPAEAQALAEFLGRSGAPARIEVQADPGLEQGGVVFSTARGELDASAGTQLEEIARGFADVAERTVA